MHSFTKEEIDAWRKDNVDKRYPFEFGRFDEHLFLYFIVPQSNNPELLNFALRITGKPRDGYVIGVSDSLKPEFRPYVAFHEFYEYIVIGINVEDNCINALEKELSVVPDGFNPEYVTMRTQFFKDLIDYRVRKKLDERDTDEFRKSRDYLERLL